MPTNANIYKVDWFKLVSWLLPNALFKPKMYAWCKALVAPIVMVHNDLLIFRKAKLEELTLTPQIGSIVYYLNKRYDSAAMSIYITNGQRGIDQYIFNEIETETDWCFDDASIEQMYVYNDADVGATPAQFIVWLPVALQPKSLEIAALITIQRLPGKRFQLQYF